MSTAVAQVDADSKKVSQTKLKPVPSLQMIGLQFLNSRSSHCSTLPLATFVHNDCILLAVSQFAHVTSCVQSRAGVTLYATNESSPRCQLAGPPVFSKSSAEQKEQRMFNLKGWLIQRVGHLKCSGWLQRLLDRCCQSLFRGLCLSPHQSAKD